MRQASAIEAPSPPEAPKSIAREWLILALALAMAAGMWFFSQWVMAPAERAYYAAKGQPMDIGDLYPRWYGARELLLHHRDPYSLEVSREIQVAYYGHPLDTAGADRGRDEQRFAYPVYVVFFLAPTIDLPFSRAQAVVRWTLAFLAATSVLLWLLALRWRPPALVTVALIALTVSSPPMMYALRLQQLAVFVAFSLAGCMALLSRGRLFWAGCLLACATVKPQLALMPVLWFLIWATGDWKQRRRLALGFAAALGLLVAAGEAILPAWLPEFVRGLIAYGQYVKVSSLLDLYLTQGMAKPVAAILLGGILILCYRWRKTPVRHPGFFFLMALVLTVMVIALPVLPPFNQVLLLPGLLGLIAKWSTLWNRGGPVRAACCVGAALLLSCWLLGSLLAVLHMAAPRVALGGTWTWPFLISYLIPPIVMGLLLAVLQDIPDPRPSSPTQVNKLPPDVKEFGQSFRLRFADRAFTVNNFRSNSFDPNTSLRSFWVSPRASIQCCRVCCGVALRIG
jgi:hypothetical protein